MSKEEDKLKKDLYRDVGYNTEFVSFFMQQGVKLDNEIVILEAGINNGYTYEELLLWSNLLLAFDEVYKKSVTQIVTEVKALCEVEAQMKKTKTKILRKERKKSKEKS